MKHLALVGPVASRALKGRNPGRRSRSDSPYLWVLDKFSRRHNASVCKKIHSRYKYGSMLHDWSRNFLGVGTFFALLAPSFAAEPSDSPNPFPATEAAQRMTVADGFRVTLFAG